MVWPLGVYFLVVVALVALILTASHLLGERHHRPPATGAPYESGIVPVGSARVRFSAQFYLVAAFFVIFDLESIFIFAWAAAGRALGWAAYLELVVFIAVLLAALVYLGRVGALEFGRGVRTALDRGERAP
jgi:NADH-quinone oxidoreductase subunit A